MAGASVVYNFLGRAGLKVSNICLGTVTFGTGKCHRSRCPTQSDETTAHKILDRFAQLGGNFIDTANTYGFGQGEEIVGNWISRQDREQFVLATKVGLNMDPTRENVNKVGLSRRHVIESCEESLRRLKVDSIDLLQAHHWDDGTPLEVSLRAFDDLIRCGKIRYYGYCNVSGWQMQKIAETAKALNLNLPVTLQQQYNLLSRQSELEAFMVCQNEGLAILPWSPLKGGILTGKFPRDETLDSTGSRVGYVAHNLGLGLKMAPVWSAVNSDNSYWNLIAVMETIAAATGRSLAQVAIRWLLQKQNVASVIIGATSVKQLEDNMGGAIGWRLSQEEMDLLNSASPRTKEYPYEMMYRSSDRWNEFNKTRSKVV